MKLIQKSLSLWVAFVMTVQPLAFAGVSARWSDEEDAPRKIGAAHSPNELQGMNQDLWNWINQQNDLQDLIDRGPFNPIDLSGIKKPGFSKRQPGSLEKLIAGIATFFGLRPEDIQNFRFIVSEDSSFQFYMDFSVAKNGQNTHYVGLVTEDIMETMTVGSKPIYSYSIEHLIQTDLNVEAAIAGAQHLGVDFKDILEL